VGNFTWVVKAMYLNTGKFCWQQVWNTLMKKHIDPSHLSELATDTSKILDKLEAYQSSLAYLQQLYKSHTKCTCYAYSK